MEQLGIVYLNTPAGRELSVVPIERPDVSVIVPIYNAEKYLSDTLKSLTAQTLDTLEIILVDDNSTDSSPIICKKFADVDKRIRIFTNTTQMGVSASRNLGLRHARGAYFAFVDSDDIVHEEMYMRLFKTAVAADADIVISNLRVVHDGGSRQVVTYNRHPKNVQLGRHYLMTNVIAPLVGIKIDPSLFVGNSACDKLFRASNARNGGITFDEGRLRFEDRLFVVEFLATAKSVTFVDEAFYSYIRRPKSLQTRYNPGELDAVISNQLRYRELFEKDFDFDSPMAVQYRVSAITDVIFSTLSHSRGHSEANKRTTEVLCNPHVVEWYSKLQPPGATPFYRVVRRCINSNHYTLAHLLFQAKFLPVRLKLLARRLAVRTGMMPQSVA
ncbi:glycosyltransferase family 2 protein [Tessaracoccus flavus]|uniref:glycosyltransferase family 2 protein n=1 Tax=Tessaracoccus flavus TaxID=1610493 RepID=UPI00139001BA|nr:glycosyltransferase family 2 protein [Tessaracoccus flavus]